MKLISLFNPEGNYDVSFCPSEAWEVIADLSPNTTKTAAVLFDVNDCAVIGAANNDFPEGVINKEERLARPAKYSFMNHSEQALIAGCARRGIKTDGKGVWMRWFPCDTCARVMIEAGIKKLVCDKPELKGDIAEFWHFKEALQMLTEAGVEIEYNL